MEINTKYAINQDIFYVERERVIETCSTCKGKRKINVTNGEKNWNIKCPDCHGKGKAPNVINYGVAGDTIKEVIAKRSETFSYTKYVLYSGITKSEKALFSDVEEAEKQCSILNEQIKRNRKENQDYE